MEHKILKWQEKLKHILHTDDVFHGFSAEAKAQFLAQAYMHRYLPQQHLFNQQQHVDAVYILLSGCIQIGWLQTNGELKINDYIHRHSAFNIVALLQHKVLTYDYFAVGSVEIAYIPATLFLHILKQEPEAMWQLLHLLSYRMYNLFEQQRYLQTGSLEQRIARYLIKMHQQYGERIGDIDMIRFRMSQQEFSELFNVSRQTLNKYVQNFVQSGLIEWNYSQITILDIQRLKQMSQF